VKRSFHWSRGPADAPDEVRREIELHLELRAREFEAQGMTPEAARREALEAFGDRGAIESELRDLRGGTLRERRRRDRLGELRQDLRVAVRGLLRAPGFTIVALLTLALGIGANSAIFSVIRSVLLRPLPYPDSDRLVQLWTDYRARGRSTPEWLQPPEFLDWRAGNQTFAGMAAYTGWGPDLTGAGEPAALAGIAVSGNYFKVVGVSPAIGRGLTLADDDPGAERVLVLADPIWRRRFGADRGIVGRQLQLNGEPWTVVGILPRDFRPPVPFAPDVYRALRRPADSRCGRGCIVWRAIGRLKPGVTLAQAHADLNSVAARLARDYPATNQDVRAWPIPLHEQITGPTRLPLLALTGAVAFVLLIACVNLANLLLVRGAGRARELGVRAALGAGRGRLVRQLLTESSLLAAVGGALGLLLSLVGAHSLGTLVPPAVRGIQEIGIDGTVVAFTAGLTLLSGLLFGLLPAAQAARTDLMGVLRSSGRDAGRRSGTLRGGLVVAELAFAVVLLVGAGLLLRSFLLMQRLDLGYRARGVVFVPVGFPRVRYPDAPRILSAVDDILARVRGNPAVRAAELTDLPPLSPGDQDMTAIPLGESTRPGRPEGIWYRGVSAGYLAAMHTKLVAGRLLAPADRRGSPYVGVINQEAARRFWPGKNPIGRILATGEDSTAPRITIVGMIGTTHQDGPNQPPKVELFVPIGQWPSAGVAFVLEPARGADAAVAALRQALHEVDPLVPLGAVSSIEELIGTALALPRLYALLVGIFAGAALLLAVLGVYGVMAYAVSQRQREIGVRLALGAAPGGIQRLVLGQGGRLALAGLGIGLLAALGLSRLVTRLLFGVGAFDLPTYTAVSLVLGGMALLACWLPARRAMRVDPLVAIREE
jgi:putative ABC transport system permease protein